MGNDLNDLMMQWYRIGTTESSHGESVKALEGRAIEERGRGADGADGAGFSCNAATIETQDNSK